MRWDTCRNPSADKNLINIDAPSAFSFSEYLEREGGEQTGLSFDFKSHDDLYSLSFLEVEVGDDSWQKLMIEILAS